MYFLKYEDTVKKLKDSGYLKAFDQTRQTRAEFQKGIYLNPMMDESMSDQEREALSTHRNNFFNEFMQDDEPILKLDAQALEKIGLKVDAENILLATYQNNKLTLFEVDYSNEIGYGDEARIIQGRNLETGENLAIKGGCDYGFSDPCYMGWKLAQKKLNSSPYFVKIRAAGQICLPVHTNDGVKVELYRSDSMSSNAILVMEKIQNAIDETRLVSRARSWNIEQVYKFLQHLLDAYEMFVKAGIEGWDWKESNVLIDEHNLPKFCDFNQLAKARYSVDARPYYWQAMRSLLYIYADTIRIENRISEFQKPSQIRTLYKELGAWIKNENRERSENLTRDLLNQKLKQTIEKFDRIKYETNCNSLENVEAVAHCKQAPQKRSRFTVRPLPLDEPEIQNSKVLNLDLIGSKISDTSQKTTITNEHTGASIVKIEGHVSHSIAAGKSLIFVGPHSRVQISGLKSSDHIYLPTSEQHDGLPHCQNITDGSILTSKNTNIVIETNTSCDTVMSQITPISKNNSLDSMHDAMAFIKTPFFHSSLFCHGLAFVAAFRTEIANTLLWKFSNGNKKRYHAWQKGLTEFREKNACKLVSDLSEMAVRLVVPKDLQVTENTAHIAKDFMQALMFAKRKPKIYLGILARVFDETMFLLDSAIPYVSIGGFTQILTKTYDQYESSHSKTKAAHTLIDNLVLLIPGSRVLLDSFERKKTSRTMDEAKSEDDILSDDEIITMECTKKFCGLRRRNRS